MGNDWQHESGEVNREKCITNARCSLRVGHHGQAAIAFDLFDAASCCSYGFEQDCQHKCCTLQQATSLILPRMIEL